MLFAVIGQRIHFNIKMHPCSISQVYRGNLVVLLPFTENNPTAAIILLKKSL
jgi:hypothetical protein